jgi:S-adenosylmethionine:tRNA ribosyltransferase-isomerase
VLELALGRLATAELFDRHVLGQVDGVRTLEAREPGVDTAPARAHEVDEQREIVDARVAFREEVALDPLEAADRLVQETADLGDVPCHREDLGAQTVSHRGADVCGNRCLELRGGGSERLDLIARALERGLDRAGCGAARRGVRDPLLRTFERQGVHVERGYSPRRMDSSVLEYDLPPELVAQHPVEPRDSSRLLVYRRDSGEVEHARVSDLPDLVDDQLLVVNDTRVVPARLHLHRATGAAVEVLLVESLGDGRWEALARPSRRLRTGEALGPVRLVESLADGRWLVELDGEPAGEAPLPPYIHEPLADAERYQTVYGEVAGSAAAPTAGLHFTPRLVELLDPARVTLHVGLDTFRPLTEAVVEDHVLHGERYSVDEAEWGRIASARSVLAVGTTTVRVLETVARSNELAGRTMLFITPGFAFRRVDALLTNFHLPRSTLLALVMAFVGIEETLAIYRTAIAERYRFYSFGDAMVVL